MSTAKHRVIMHLDMDAFFVSVELLQHPDLRGRQIIVARESERSVVLSASYEARALGVRSAMPLVQAKRKAPHALVIEPSQPYAEYSKQVMAMLHELTDRVEQVSVDEAFVDLTSTIKRLGSPVDVAQAVRARIQQELNLPSSAGIASNKFIAKMASSGSKPNGLWVIPPHRIQEFLDPMPVGKLWGIGPKTTSTIESLGIHTVAQLREYNLPFLRQRFGQSLGTHLYNICRGIDDREVVTSRVEKSIGAEHTFLHDTYSAQELKREIFKLSLGVARRLRASGKYAQSMSLKIRFDDFETITRSCILKTPTDSGQQLNKAVLRRLGELGIVPDGEAPLPRAIRLMGVRAENLKDRASGIQESLFAEDLTPDSAESANNWFLAETMMDEIQTKFGSTGLLPANLLKKGSQDSGGR